jgi:hypothetical protein
MRLLIGIFLPRAETRSPSPNTSPRAPAWPAASEANRSWSMRVNETRPRQSVRASRQAQVLIRCATPPRATIKASPHPSAEIFSRRRPGPTREIKQASSAMPETAAAVRKAICLIVAELDIGEPLCGSCSAELLVKDTLRVGQCLRSVDILPHGILNIEGT